MSAKLINITDHELRQPPPGQTRPIPPPTSEGRIPFSVPNHPDLKVETWYQIHGTLSADTVPLIILHGGPGMGHNYVKTLAHLSTGPYARPVILYDQLGCGKSTHLRDKREDASFWTVSLFIAELDNLAAALKIHSFDLLGQSWGGMLAAEYAALQPPRLRKVVIADSPTDMHTWVKVANELRALLPKDVQETLTKCEAESRFDKEYEGAMEVFYKYFVCRVQPFPKEIEETLAVVGEDDTVYFTMNGPSEFHVIGSLKDWDVRPRLPNIVVPTLVINGKFDEAQDVTVAGYFNLIKGPVKWVRFAESGHCPHLEETDDYMRTVGRWLAEGV
ncbi:proline-specific peptidase [Myriangium duriaei CBS 260.36]|uniref:Proline-specific peptidase n=1 Tax=Myriangium duriaei CBS 260.36 TaxID=1168546 RepID=A0A9P4IZT3_9PEZI|nr:proline-specific peptidase [Myriangium duriaei CBS 260.36]